MPLGLDRGGAIQRCLSAIRGDTGRRSVHHQRARALRMTHGEMDGDRGADRGAGQRDLAGDAGRVQQRARSSAMSSNVTLPRIFSDSPAPRVS